jgi:transposase
VIQKIYKIERQMSEEGLEAEARQCRREECSRPLMTALRTQVDQLSYESPPKTPMGRAITYALRPDNNAVENSLRPIAIGRKNWLSMTSGSTAKNRRISHGIR